MNGYCNECGHPLNGHRWAHLKTALKDQTVCIACCVVCMDLPKLRLKDSG